MVLVLKLFNFNQYNTCAVNWLCLDTFQHQCACVLKPRPKHPTKLHVWAGISKKGRTSYLSVSWMLPCTLTLYPRHACAESNLVATRQYIEKMAILYHDDS